MIKTLQWRASNLCIKSCLSRELQHGIQKVTAEHDKAHGSRERVISVGARLGGASLRYHATIGKREKIEYLYFLCVYTRKNKEYINTKKEGNNDKNTMREYHLNNKRMIVQYGAYLYMVIVTISPDQITRE